MKHKKSILFLVALSLAISGVSFAKRIKKSEAETGTEVVASKTIAIGDVDAGYTMGGSSPVDVKETIQICMKKELEKLGNGAYNTKITSPAIVVEGKEADTSNYPTLPSNRVPTQQELAKYMAAMQRMQDQMSGKVKVFKPVEADAYIEFKIQSGKGGADTGGVMGTLGQLTGLDTSFGSISTETVKVHLVCTMREPKTGELLDRYTAKTSSVKFKNLGGFTSYDYGDDEIARERLFKQAVQKCAKWLHDKIK